MGQIELMVDADEVIDQLDTDDLIEELATRSINARQSKTLMEMAGDNLSDKIKIGLFIENMDNFTIDQFQSFINNL
jgi:hypothetical protein